MQITQKTFTTKKEISIESNGVLIKTKNLREELEYRIKFDELGFDIVKKRIKTANIAFYTFLLFDLLYLGLLISSVISDDPFSQQLFWLFALLMFSIFTVASFESINKDVIYLTGGQKVLELSAVKPDSETVLKFIDTIHQSMRQHFKNSFFQFDFDTPYEFRLNHLKWLKEIKALTDDEYKELLDNTKTNNIIGFQRPDEE